MKLTHGYSLAMTIRKAIQAFLVAALPAGVAILSVGLTDPTTIGALHTAWPAIPLVLIGSAGTALSNYIKNKDK